MGPNLQGKVVSAPPGTACTPQAEQESNFLNTWEIWMVGVVNLVVLACVLRATTKKRKKVVITVEQQFT